MPRWPISLPVAPWVWGVRRLRRALLRRIGGAGIVAVVALATAAAAWPLQLRERDNLRRLQSQLDRVRSTPRAAAAPRLADSRAALDRFDAFLPSRRETAVVVRELYIAAEAAGLVFERGEYNSTVDAAGGFTRFRMSLPVTGEPQAVHAFMMAALQAHPALALQSVQFRREQADSPLVEARIQWTLFTRLPGPADTTTAAAAMKVSR